MATLSQPLSEEEKVELINRIKSELRRLHIPGKVRGFSYLTYMLSEIIPDHDQLILITKNLYPDTGHKFDATSSSVERAARTAITISWKKGGRDTLDQMACYHLVECPTTSEFLDIVADYIRRTK